jgi:outer membrane protein assembly factor BamB
MQNNDSHDEKVEIVDLDTPNSSWQHHILHTAHRLLANAPARGKIIALALLCSILILLVVLQSSLHVAPPGTTHPTPSAIPMPQQTSFTMSAANGIVYIAGRDGSLTAHQALDGTARWQIKSSQGAYSSPVASGQAVYVILTLGKDNRIEERQASNGTSLWMSQALPLASASPIVQGGVVYANTQSGTIYAFDAATGKALWHFASRQSMPIYTFFSAAKNIATISTIDDIVYVLQARSGKVLWHYQLDPHSTRWYQVDNGIFYNTSDSGPLQAFSINTGKLLWQYTQAENNIGSLTAYNGVVYINIRDGGMTALRGQDGKLLWHNSATAALSSITLPIDNNILYVSSSDDDRLIGLRASDGKQLWQHKIDGLGRYALHWIDSRNDILYLIQDDSAAFTERQGSIQGRSISSGKLLWHFTLSSHIGGFLNEVDGILYLRLTDGTMDVIRLSDGKLLWHYSA